MHKTMKKFNKIFAFAMVALFGLSLAACNDDEFTTNPYSKGGVNLLAFGPCPTERTHEIRITGTNMNAVDKVIFPADATVEEAVVTRSEFIKADAENIYLNIPDPTVPGHIKLVAGRDTVVSEGIINFVEPIEVTEVTPVKNLNAGDYITIKGDYVYNIASVTFTSGALVPAEEFISASRREIVVPVPLAAESGVITMTDGDEWKLEWKEPLEIISASITSLSTNAADFGEEITIKGTNLHTVEKVMFAGGVESEFKLVDKNTITTIVPDECKSGEITLILYSGATVQSEVFSVPEVSILSVTPAVNLMDGDVVTVVGENFDRIKAIYLPGIDEALNADQYTKEGNTITFVVPEDMTDGSLKFVQNANIAPTFDLKMKKMGYAIWTGKINVASWGGALEVNANKPYWDDFKNAMKGPGKLIVHIKKTGGDCNFGLSLCNNWESPIPSQSNRFTWLTDGMEDLEFDLTQEDIDVIIGQEAGFVVWGEGPFTIKCIEFVPEGGPDYFWQGECGPTNWDGDKKIMFDETMYSKIAAGKTLVIEFYLPDPTKVGQIEVCGTWWTGLEGFLKPGGARGIWDFTESGSIEGVLTANDIDVLKTQGGILFVGNGNLIVTGMYCR